MLIVANAYNKNTRERERERLVRDCSADDIDKIHIVVYISYTIYIVILYYNSINLSVYQQYFAVVDVLVASLLEGVPRKAVPAPASLSASTHAALLSSAVLPRPMG